MPFPEIAIIIHLAGQVLNITQHRCYFIKLNTQVLSKLIVIFLFLNMQRTSKMHSFDAPQSNEILPAQRSKEHLRHSAGKICAPSLERGSKVVKLLGSSGKSVKKKDAIKGPAVILGSSHTGSALVKA